MTLATQRGGDSLKIAYLLVIESMPYAWTNRADLVGYGSTFFPDDDREILGGLLVPDSLPQSCDPRLGIPDDERHIFSIIDEEGLVGPLFAPRTAQGALTPIAQTFDPGDTIPATDADGKALRERYINGEYIGPAGERRYRYITPDPVPGMLHIRDPAGNITSVMVSDDPHVFAGLRVGLYRCLYDAELGTWGDFDDQYQSGGLIWIGRLVDRAERKTPDKFDIEISGMRSWLEGSLNKDAPSAWYNLTPRVNLSTGEDYIAIWVQRITAAGGEGIFGPSETFAGKIFQASELLTGTSQQALNEEISALVSEVNSGTDCNLTGTAFNATASKKVGYSTNGNISVKGESANAGWFRIHIAVHEKVAAALGHWWKEPGATGGNAALSSYGGTLFGGPLYYQNVVDGFIPADLESGYVVIARDNIIDGETGLYGGTQGAVIHPPQWSRGAFTISPDGRQTVSINLENEYCPGQLARAPAALVPTTPQIDGQDVDSMGWVAIRGEIARETDESGSKIDRVLATQIALASWDIGGTGTIAAEELTSVVHLDSLEEPRLYGYVDDRRITYPLTVGGTDEGGTSLQMAFVARLGGYTYSGPTYLDEVWRVVTRTLTSSGTAVWGASVPTAGDNQPTAATGVDYWGGDLEHSSLGLNIPDAAVDFASWRTSAQRLPNGETGPLARCLYAMIGPQRADEILAEAHQSRGWCIGFVPGTTHPQFRCWEPFRDVSPAEVEVELTDSDLAAAVGESQQWIPKWASRPFPPLDVFEIEASGIPEEPGTYTYKDRVGSGDRGAKQRTSRVVHRMRDRGLVNAGAFEPGEYNWPNEWRTVMARQVGVWAAARNSVLEVMISHSKGRLLGNGTAVRVSFSTAPKLDGTGMGLSNALGRVWDVEPILTGAYAGCNKVRMVIQERAENEGDGGRIWTPSAKVIASVNTGGSSWTLTCKADWLGIGHDSTDVAGFVEPSWSSYGGTLAVKVIQSFNGRDWGNVVLADVVSVDTGTDEIDITVTSGTLYRDTWKILLVAPYDDQDANNWARNVFSWHTDATGEFGSGPTQGWKLD